MGQHMQKGRNPLRILNLQGADKKGARKSSQSDVAFNSQDDSQLEILPENFQGNSFGLFLLCKLWQSIHTADNPA